MAHARPAWESRRIGANVMRLPFIQTKADACARGCVIALGISIPISTVLDNILLVAILVLWLAAGRYRERIAIVRENPVAIAALALFGLLTLGLVYGTQDAGSGIRYLGKYVDLLFVPVFLTCFQDAKSRERGLLLFCIAGVAAVLISYMASTGLMVDAPLLPRTAENPYAFKASITHSLLVAFTSYVFMLLARQERRPRYRNGYVVLSLLAAHNVVFMNWGRTGYLVLVVLLVYFFIMTYGRRGLLFGAMAAVLISVTAYTTSTAFHNRIDAATGEFQAWGPARPATTSIGQRLEFYTTTAGIIREHPLIGTGTGSFPGEYAHAVEGQGKVATENPHNEYLLITVQIGLIGLASMICLFWAQWRSAARFAEPFYRDLARGLVLMFVVGCLFNSLLVDHTEGLLFAWFSGLLFAAPVKSGLSSKAAA
jgi:O-antigen ligase